jgi:hypothetical protein
MTITDLVLIAILVADLIFAVTIVFFDTKNPADVWAWLFGPLLLTRSLVCSLHIPRPELPQEEDVSVEARCGYGLQAPHRIAEK